MPAYLMVIMLMTACTGLVIYLVRSDLGRTISQQLKSRVRLRNVNAQLLEENKRRMETERALRDSETNFRMLFTANPQPMWVIDRDTGQFLAVNQAAERVYGYEMAEFQSMTVDIIEQKPITEDVTQQI
jgi:PAS domain-containing protein